MYPVVASVACTQAGGACEERLRNVLFRVITGLQRCTSGEIKVYDSMENSENGMQMRQLGSTNHAKKFLVVYIL